MLRPATSIVVAGVLDYQHAALSSARDHTERGKERLGRQDFLGAPIRHNATCQKHRVIARGGLVDVVGRYHR